MVPCDAVRHDAVRHEGMRGASLGEVRVSTAYVFQRMFCHIIITQSCGAWLHCADAQYTLALKSALPGECLVAFSVVLFERFWTHDGMAFLLSFARGGRG